MSPSTLSPKGEDVSRMFGRIARRYDLANRILSFGLCVHWRNTFVAEAVALKPKQVADLATGSGDVAFALRAALPESTHVTGYDFCEPLLEIARERIAKESTQGLSFQSGDCMHLPLADNAVDVVTIAYGVRNFEDRPKGLRELRRVVRTGGSVLILEFSQPVVWFRPLHFIHVRMIAPIVATILTGDLAAYRYLGTSIAGFPDADGLSAELRAAGFSAVRCRQMLFGTVAMHIATA